jgi:hypothetical protein
MDEVALRLTPGERSYLATLLNDDINAALHTAMQLKRRRTDPEYRRQRLREALQSRALWRKVDALRYEEPNHGR